MLNSLDRIFPLHRARTFLITQFAENFERDGIRETMDTGRRLPQIKQRRLNDFMDRNPAQGRNRIKAVYFLRAQHWRRRAVPQDPNASDEDFETRFPLLLTTLPLMA